MDKKPLDDVLRVSRRVAAASNESVKRRPVCFTKSRECFPRGFIRLCLACLQNDGPMRRLERRASFLQRPWNRFREQLLSPGGRLGDKKSSDDSVKEQEKTEGKPESTGLEPATSAVTGRRSNQLS